MKEELLHFIWHLQYFRKENLTTGEGQSLQIVVPGTHNAHAGPDFSQARLFIDEIEWRGAVEIHLKASDWEHHGHQYDAAYNAVILHVVWDADRAVYRQDGTPMPTLSLKNRVDPTILHNYQQLTFTSAAHRRIPCASVVPEVSDLQKISTLERAATQRLGRKAEEILTLLAANQGDWSETAHQVLARSFGFRINSAPLEQLSRAVPLRLVRKYIHGRTSLLALLLGQADLLEQYPEQTETYTYLAAKHQLNDQKLSRSQWKFFRTRPANFPDVRIAQWAEVLVAQEANLGRLFSCLPLVAYEKMFYTEEQFLRDHSSLGKSSITTLLINAIIPFQFAYGQYYQKQDWKDHALSLLQALPAEKNSIVRDYRQYAFPVQSALDTQAILELFHYFCSPRKCLSCPIGTSVIRSQELVVA